MHKILIGNGINLEPLKYSYAIREVSNLKKNIVL